MRQEENRTVLGMLYNFGHGTKVYSPIWGEGEVYSVTDRIMVKFASEHNNKRFDTDGKICGAGECVLFPSSTERNWDNFRYWECFNHGDFIVVNNCPLIFDRVDGGMYFTLYGRNVNSNHTFVNLPFGPMESLCYPYARFMTEGEKNAFLEKMKEEGFHYVNGKVTQHVVKKGYDYKDGDFIKLNNTDKYIIFREGKSETEGGMCYHAYYDGYMLHVGESELNGMVILSHEICEFDDMLFFNDIMLENGYRFEKGKVFRIDENISPEFNVGDIIVSKTNKDIILTVYEIDYQDGCYYTLGRSKDGVKQVVASHLIDGKYDLFKLKFKVGDVIEFIKDYGLLPTRYVIEGINGTYYEMTGGCRLSVKLQDSYTLYDITNEETKKRDDSEETIIHVSEKIPFKTLEKVLVRNGKDDKWVVSLFCYIVKENGEIFYECFNGRYRECLPYNEKTEHLLGKVGDAPDTCNVEL